MTPADAARLQAVYRRETRGLLQYVPGAAPYAGPDGKALDAILRAAGEEAEAIGALVELLEAGRVTVPQPGAFPAEFTDLNFVTVRRLLPKLVAEQTRAVADLEADRAALTDPAARAAVGRLVDLHQTHLAAMQG